MLNREIEAITSLGKFIVGYHTAQSPEELEECETKI
jgi:hypothetical protein